MSLLTWILFGLIIGIIATLFESKTEDGGFLGTIILGVLGALLGGFLASLIFNSNITGFNLHSFIIASLGSISLLVVSRLVKRF